MKSFVLLEAVLRNDALDLLLRGVLIAAVLRALEPGMLILIFYHGPESLGKTFRTKSMLAFIQHFYGDVLFHCKVVLTVANRAKEQGAVWGLVLQVRKLVGRG